MRTAISSKPEDIKAKVQELKNILAEVSAEAYRNAGAQPAEATGPQQGAPGAQP